MSPKPFRKIDPHCYGGKCRPRVPYKRNVNYSSIVDMFRVEKTVSPEQEILAEREVLSFFDYILNGEEGYSRDNCYYDNYSIATTAPRGMGPELTLTRAERFQLPLTKELESLCYNTAKLWNHANWLVRMRYFTVLDPERLDVKEVHDKVFEKTIRILKDLKNIKAYPFANRASVEQKIKGTIDKKIDQLSKPYGKQGYHPFEEKGLAEKFGYEGSEIDWNDRPYYYRDPITGEEYEKPLANAQKTKKGEEYRRVTNQMFYAEMNDTIRFSRFYRAMNTTTAQQVLRLLSKAWKGYFNAKKAWRSNPSSFPDGRSPRPPGFHHRGDKYVAVFTNQECSIQDGKLSFPTKVSYRANLKSSEEREVWNKWQTKGIMSLTEEERYILDTIEFPGREKGFYKRGTVHWFENEKWFKRLKIRPQINNLRQVRIVPKKSCYVLELVHDIQVRVPHVDKSRILGIDIGMNTLLATVNNVGLPPMLIGGGVVKSINQFANKLMARYRSELSKRGITEDNQQISRIFRLRDNKMSKLFHDASQRLVRFCTANKVGKIIVGYNPGWKKGNNVSRKFRSNFYPIPFTKLTHMIRYKAEEVGIEVVETEESYTSQDCGLCGQRHRKSSTRGQMSGRAKRGLYACPTYYKLINADVNGAINIIKKIEPRAFDRVPVSDLVIAPRSVRLEYSRKGYSKGKSGLHTAGRPIYHKSKRSPRV